MRSAKQAMKVAAGGVMTLLAINVAANCYLDTTEDCPSSVNWNGGTCDLDTPGDQRKDVTTASPVDTGADGWYELQDQCEYWCPHTFSWETFYPGRRKSGSNCTG